MSESLAEGLEEDREEDKARSMPPITPGSLSYKADTAPGATVTLSADGQGIAARVFSITSVIAGCLCVGD